MPRNKARARQGTGLCLYSEAHMRFNAAQLKQYHTQGYVVVPCPFPAELTHACLNAVDRAGIDPGASPPTSAW